jgi:integrase
MKARLVARNPKDNMVSLYAEYRHEDKFKRVPTGIRIGVKYWDNEKQRIRANGTKDVEKDNIHIQSVLAELANRIKELYTQNRNSYPTVGQLNASYKAQAVALTQESAPPVPKATVTVSLQSFMEEKSDWAVATRKGFATLKKNIEEYELAQKATWLLDTVSNDDITAWQHWLLEKKDYKNATLGKRVRLLRQFLREKEAPKVNLAKVKPLHSQMLTPPVVLHQTEIDALHVLNLKGSPRLARVRDLMIAQIFSGLRFSDLIRLQQDNLVKGHIVIRMQKTNQTVRVPMFPQFQQVAEKYTDSGTNELRLPDISNQKFNEYLKELCQLVPALLEPVTIEYKKRNKTLSEQIPKWQLITSHSSRRSFCSLCLDLGYSTKQVMSWSGHRTLSAFSRYIGQSDLRTDAADDFAARYENVKSASN